MTGTPLLPLLPLRPVCLYVQASKPQVICSTFRGWLKKADAIERSTGTPYTYILKAHRCGCLLGAQADLLRRALLDHELHP